MVIVTWDYTGPAGGCLPSHSCGSSGWHHRHAHLASVHNEKPGLELAKVFHGSPIPRVAMYLTAFLGLTGPSRSSWTGTKI